MNNKQESLLQEIEELNKLIQHKRSMGLDCSKERKMLTKLILELDNSEQDKEFEEVIEE